ncbi:DUF1090 family protein [Pseudomonas segetis]|uniref:DUF1090 domain-containing protein n=1 Tax=Pseudomonas segetis TaxID=298908 RepID=A0A239ID78_9PSED|nr:DUF1090 family protein [Pseudomonas segetis]SNS91198.1 Protein of unknown function [Pseudomonas segetis]
MLKRSTLIFLLSGAALLTNAVITAQASDPLKNCISKRQELRDKTEEVGKLGDATRLANIQQELGKLEAQCAKLGLHSTQGTEVSEAQLKVSARKKNLVAALGAGDANSIAESQKLLSKARKTLEQVESQSTRS